MKRFFVLALMAMVAACNSNEPSKDNSTKPASDSTMQRINSPYTIGYSSDFVIDNPKNAETLLMLWKDWDNGNLSAHKDIFADTVEMHFAEGAMFRGSRDSAIAAAQSARNTYTSAVSSVDAVIAAKATDKNENWALIWGKEVDTDKKGKTDSFYLQETWRFNKDGKADLMFQYKQQAAPPKK